MLGTSYTGNKRYQQSTTLLLLLLLLLLPLLQLLLLVLPLFLLLLLQVVALSALLVREVYLVLLVVLLHQPPDHRVDFIHIEVEDSSVRVAAAAAVDDRDRGCLLYTSPSPRDQRGSRMPSSA